jgi:colanic acid/amylovoran biosynthesis glycosyltransferase
MRSYAENIFRHKGEFILPKLNRNLSVIFRGLNVPKYGRMAWSFNLFRKGLIFLGEKPFDVYHCHFGGLGRLVADLIGIGAVQGKLITTFHGYDITKSVKQFGRNIYKRLFTTGDLFLPISYRWKDRLIELGCSEEKIVVHRMGVDLNKFNFSSRRFCENKRLRLLTVGRLVEKKGVEYGIRGVCNAINTYPNIDFEYTIVGDGPLKEKLFLLVKELNLDKIVRIVGSKSHQEVRMLMDSADLLLCPSVTSSEGDQEGIPVVIMEAMACGLPVISTFHSGIPELVKDGETGFLVNERDVNGLAKKIKLLLENYNSLGDIGAKARTHIEKFYDIKKLNKQLVDLYKSC